MAQCEARDSIIEEMIDQAVTTTKRRFDTKGGAGLPAPLTVGRPRVSEVDGVVGVVTVGVVIEPVAECLAIELIALVDVDTECGADVLWLLRGQRLGLDH